MSLIIYLHNKLAFLLLKKLIYVLIPLSFFLIFRACK
jgi:hypothetical protein